MKVKWNGYGMKVAFFPLYCYLNMIFRSAEKPSLTVGPHFVKFGKAPPCWPGLIPMP
jgi:hypothetical protein